MWLFVILFVYGFACLIAGLGMGRSSAYREMADAMREAKARVRSRTHQGRPE